MKARHSTQYEELFAGTAKRVVKGVGHVSLGGDRGSTGRPLNEAEHGTEIMTRSPDTLVKSRAAAMAGAWETDDGLAGSSPEGGTHPANPHKARDVQAAERAAGRKNDAANSGKNGT